MITRVLRNSMILVLGLIAMEDASAQDAPRLEGVWSVNVAIHDCAPSTSGPINVQAVNLFVHGGSMTEAANNPHRTSSVGTWRHLQGNSYSSTFWFFRFDSDGIFVSTAKVTRTIDLSSDGGQFTSTGTVEDFKTDGTVSVKCPVETAARL